MKKTHCKNDNKKFGLDMTEKLSEISKTLELDISTIEQNNISILNDIDDISKELSELESTAAMYFINCLLTEYSKESAEISQAIHKLSRLRHGALIVIEKNEPVSPWITGGIPINARVTSQLLESIFNPKSQLYDGAVVVKQNLIVSAANQLPFTEQIFWDRMFDPREMSAVGLSERCNALILLVSENGSTSFCINGSLYPFSVK
ncbi:hypothetical protein J31TS4_03200 [Paenibacillus sp. J31TS4]|uniref:DNA integrity scanning protein DisA nucleotide-binding domain protein n=1 Tax=Paenibacillus sp. J31TS4 TaxID=2807195 RepID=UPI001B1BD901|nr:DNA integrity scanning protein DisA nucleotide-binding domain protein [Paenibacillus sp. J31TS4]GIP37040.1 hypothetical protein J31TS4_03200 [Paenibacillus sp. J31TS4]